jgi:hypothetical protein
MWSPVVGKTEGDYGPAINADCVVNTQIPLSSMKYSLSFLVKVVSPETLFVIWLSVFDWHVSLQYCNGGITIR